MASGPPRSLDESYRDAQAHLDPRLLRLRPRDRPLGGALPRLRRVEHARRAGPAQRLRAAAGRAAPGDRPPAGGGGDPGDARRRRGRRARPAEHRDRGARQRPRRRDRARLAGADRRGARDRQVDADDDGARQSVRRRTADAVRVGRGVGGADPAACPAAGRGGGAGGAGDRRDRPARRAGDARAGTARGVRDRLGADAALGRPVLGRRLGGPGARGRRRDHARRQAAADRRAARRPRDQGGRARRPAGARAPRRLRPAVRGRARADLPDGAGDQEPVRLHQRGGGVRDA